MVGRWLRDSSISAGTVCAGVTFSNSRLQFAAFYIATRPCESKSISIAFMTAGLLVFLQGNGYEGVARIAFGSCSAYDEREVTIFET
eukprot:scaffold651620_cov41-Prasinocladus_malaysianus.AAC.1